MLPSGYLTELEENRFSSAYRWRLAEGLQHFRVWARRKNVADFAAAGHSHRWRDAVLVQYVQACFDAGISESIAKHSILAIQNLLHSRGNFPRSWSALRALHMQ